MFPFIYQVMLAGGLDGGDVQFPLITSPQEYLYLSSLRTGFLSGISATTVYYHELHH